MQPLVSIILPVYNVEDYIEECLESLVNQTYKNIEIIIVNDGSKDGSVNTCKRYAEKDDRIVIITQENQGLSEARNNGLRYINGEYFTFVDSDDYLDLDLIHNMVHFAAHKKCDIVLCGTTYLFDTYERVSTPLKNEIVRSTDVIKMCFKQTNGIIHSAWGKLYHINLKEELVYPKGRLYEDQFVTYHVLLKHTCGLINKSTYHYRIRQGSIMTDTSNLDKKTIDFMDSIKTVKKLIWTECPELMDSFNYKLAIDSLALVKFNAANIDCNKSFDFAVNNMRSLDIKSLLKLHLGRVFTIECLIIKYFPSLFIKIYGAKLRRNKK